jgi:peptidoglycan-N-acetylglucosamine deacetylase
MRLREFVTGIFTLLTLTSCAGQNHDESKPLKVTTSKVSTPDLTRGAEKNRTSLSANANDDKLNGLQRDVFYSGSKAKRWVALTFDDGPDMKTTPQILRILKQYHVPATFFIIGQRAQAHPEMVRQIYDDGNVIGNHSWDHPDLVRLSTQKVKDEVEQTDELLYRLIGHHPALFRPPYGAMNKRDIVEVASLGYKVIDWSVDTRDWAGTPESEILSFVQREIRPGGIILEHCAGGKDDDLSNTVKALPQIIETLKKQGYQFVTVPQLLGVQPYQNSLQTVKKFYTG